jgi:tRNA A-37 threonylcarbamoyl transferase component Bud32/tetratricopeptide (TPR) repeat protein
MAVPSANVADQLGATLGAAYTIERELGGGGMSRVFVARDLALGRPVVIKVLHPELAAGVNLDRFRREIQLAATLQHPCVVPVYGSGELDGVPYYTMPFVEGESLRARLAARGMLPMNEVVRILRDLASALGYAHARGLVHRDIKPDNILLTGGYAVVTDFGIAKAVSASRTNPDAATLTQTGTSIGTPAYMAPEQVAGDPSVDHRADIYAFGCVAYELLAGRPPFVDRALHRILAAQISERPEPVTDHRPETPPQLAALVMRCLSKDPQARPQSAAELTTVIDAVSTPASGTQETLPAIALATRRKLARALVIYAVAFLAVAVLARAAIVAIGLPDWVFPGALVVMALGLPAILFTAFTYHGAHVARTMATRAPSAPSSTMVRIAARVRPHVTWRRTWAGGAAAIAAFAAFVGGFMVLRAMGIGPAGSLLGAGKLQNHDRLVVTDFTVRGADTSIAGAITEAVRADLGQSSAISILSPSDIASALTRMQRSVSTRIDLPVAREIAAREGAKGIVDGTIAPLGAGFLLSLRLVSADSGAELASFQGTADSPRELIPTLNGLTRDLRGKIGESLRTVRSAPPLERVTTPSLDALKMYAAGERANDIDGNYADAVRLLRQAVALDTAFAMGWRKLAVAMSNLGMPSDSVTMAATKAFQHRDRLTRRERDLADGWYFSYAHPDRVQAIAAYEDALQSDSLDAIALNDLGLLLNSRREFAHGEALFHRSIASGSGGVQERTNIVLAQVAQGHVADATRSVAEVRPQSAGAPDLIIARVLTTYARGERDSVPAIFAQARSNPNLFVRALATRMQGQYELLRGHVRASEALQLDVHALDSVRGVVPPPLLAALQLPFSDIEFRNRPEDGVRALDSALARHPFTTMSVLDRPYFKVATLYARARRPDRARAVMGQYVADVRDTALRRWRAPEWHTALGEIALAERRPLDAVREFRAGDMRSDGPANDCTSCLPVSLARAFDDASMPDSAIFWYERYLAVPRGASMSPVDPEGSGVDMAAEDALHLARTYERLGALYEAKGDRARALANYRSFVDLWKDADPELQPRVMDARRQIARLSAAPLTR